MMSAIPHFHEQSTFEPQVIEAMVRALNEACAALGVSDADGRNAIAVRILDLASSGVVEPDALRTRLLREAQAD